MGRTASLLHSGLFLALAFVISSLPHGTSSVLGFLSGRSIAADVAECDICSSEELKHLRSLNLRDRAAPAHSDDELQATRVPHEAALVLPAPGASRRRRQLQESGENLSFDDLKALVEAKNEELEKANLALKDLNVALARQQMEVSNLEKMMTVDKTNLKASDLSNYKLASSSGLKFSEKTQEFLDQCKNNLVTELTSPENKDWEIYKGYACEATEEELKKYMTYDLRGLCPDDWFFVQHLIFVKNCYALPKRRCLTRTPQQFIEPLPRDVALFNQNALQDGSVRWGFHTCDSYSCLNRRTEGDCKTCFNMTKEANRWQVRYRGSLTIKEVVEMKGGSLRLGLDAGRGTGSFAAHMARYNVTVMTMAMDIEVRRGEQKGLPYMETIAQRGLIPLHAPLTARLPFFDNTLDLVHCVNSIKFLPLREFQNLLYDWDRVLRAGGIIWFELLYAREEEMKVYVQIISQLRYRRLFWELSKKPLAETNGVQYLYLNAVVEKPARAEPDDAAGGADSSN